MWRIFKHKNYHNLTDEELIKRLRSNPDWHLWNELISRYQHLIYGTIMKYLTNPDDAKDVFMEILEDYFEQFLKYEIRHFPSWIYQCTKNLCIRYLATRNKDTNKLLQYLELTEHHQEYTNDLEPAVEYSDEDLHKALQTLKVEQRVCIELFYLQNKTYQQIADLTGYTMKAVKSHIQNGKRNLKNLLTNDKTHS